MDQNCKPNKHILKYYLGWKQKKQRNIVTWETPALVPAAFAWPQFPVARAYFKPEVIVLALMAKWRLTSLPLSTHCYSDMNETSKHRIKN